jgi:hypothetical protein
MFPCKCHPLFSRTFVGGPDWTDRAALQIRLKFLFDCSIEQGSIQGETVFLRDDSSGWLIPPDDPFSRLGFVKNAVPDPTHKLSS